MTATTQKPIDQKTTTMKKMIVGIWKNLPPENAVVIFNDATANREDLEALLGRTVVDITPEGHLANQKRVVQFPIDLTRHASPTRFLAVLRGILIEFPAARQIGIITHRPLISAIKKLAEPFASRIVKSAYFGSGSDRASNDWHKQCDLLVVAGTPRVPSEAVQRRMNQFGDFDSAGEDGRWGDRYWRGRTETGEEVTVAGRGYGHPGWERAHRSLVRAAAVQAIGRGRTLLESGCDVAVVSTEECGCTFVNNLDIGLNETEAVALAALKELSELESYKTPKGPVPIAAPNLRIVSTDEIARRLGLSGRGTQKILARLESRRLIHRVCERGGWLLPTLGQSVS